MLSENENQQHLYCKSFKSICTIIYGKNNICNTEGEKMLFSLSFEKQSLWESFWFCAVKLDSSQEQLEQLKILHTKKPKVVVKWPQDSKRASGNFLEKIMCWKNYLWLVCMVSI